MPAHLELALGNAAPAQVTITNAVIAGWTGRDATAVEKHIRELEAIGVKRPSTTPIYYRVSASRVTTDAAIQATGNASSGEVEFVLLRTRDDLWVGVGSDHTDREVEAFDVTVSKQMCDKPVAPQFWNFEAVKAHWDHLELRSWIVENGNRTLYQEGTVTAMLSPITLIEGYMNGAMMPPGSIMFCGTLAAIGGVRASSRFEFELRDPVLGRTISHTYDTQSLPKVS